MEPEGSLPHSHVPTTCPYPEPARSSPCQYPTSWRCILPLSSHLRLGLQSGLFPSGYPINFDKAPRFLENLSTRGMCTVPWRHLLQHETPCRVTTRTNYRPIIPALDTAVRWVRRPAGVRQAGTQLNTEHGGNMFRRNTGTNAEYTVLWFIGPELTY